MATLRIRVVAAVDSNLANVFVPLIAAAARAKKKIAEDLAAGAAAGEHPYRQLPQKVKPAFDGVARQAKSTQMALGSVADGARERFEMLSKGLRELPVELRTVASEAQKELAKIERARAREALGLGPAKPPTLGFLVHRERIQDDVMSGFRTAGRIAGGAAAFGARVGGDFLSGIGVHTDLASMFHDTASLETLATQVSNSGYMPGDARNGRRVDPRLLESEAFKVAKETAYDPTQAMQGLVQFVGKTGDLQTGREVMKDLSTLSRATGTNLEDMVDAAGDVANTLGDIPQKGKAIYEVMRSVAGQGKLGAVEIRDLASQMAKVAASAQLFEGDRGQNIAVLGAIAQEARQRGGAASATQAATSVASFVNTFSKGARLDALKGFGVETHGDGGIRDARSIIVDALNAAMKGGTKVTRSGRRVQALGGERNFTENMGQMFADVRARSAVRGFEAIFQETYHDARGTEQERLAEATRAVNAEFDRLQQAAMSESEVQESFRRAMQTSEAQAQTFNTNLEAAANEIKGPFLSAFMAISPKLIALANKIANMVKDEVTPGAAAYETDAQRMNVLNAASAAVWGGEQAGAGPLVLDPEKGWVHKGGMGISPELVKGVGETRQAIDRELDEQQKNLASQRADLEKNYGVTDANIDKDVRNDNGIVRKFDEDAASKYIATEDRIEALQKDRERAETIANALAMQLQGGQLKVVIVEDQTQRKPPPAVDPSARGGAEAPK